MKEGTCYFIGKVDEELDLEWVDLIQEARSIGISIEEIQQFLVQNKV